MQLGLATSFKHLGEAAPYFHLQSTLNLEKTLQPSPVTEGKTPKGSEDRAEFETLNKPFRAHLFQVPFLLNVLFPLTLTKKALL